MNQDELKRQAARAALKYLEPGSILGVGSGSTVSLFFDALAKRKGRIEAAVAARFACT